MKRKSIGTEHSMCVQPTFIIGTYDDSGGIDLTQFHPVVYSGHYHSIGENLGKIGDFLVSE